MMRELLHDAVIAAPALLGCYIVRRSREGILKAMIVETEAYTATDAASHSFKGVTKRNEVMFGEAGHAYIYFTYGMHYCFNVVTGMKGDGQAVLIRAVEPVQGEGIMLRNRSGKSGHGLTNGPAKLVQAFGITKADNGIDLCSQSGNLWIEPATKEVQVKSSERIGISRDTNRMWRFYVPNSPYVSRKQ